MNVNEAKINPGVKVTAVTVILCLRHICHMNLNGWQIVGWYDIANCNILYHLTFKTVSQTMLLTRKHTYKIVKKYKMIM